MLQTYIALNAGTHALFVLYRAYNVIQWLLM